MANNRLFTTSNAPIKIKFEANHFYPDLPDFHDSNDLCMHSFIDSFDMPDSEPGLIHFHLKDLDKHRLIFEGDSGNIFNHYLPGNKLAAIKCAAESILNKLDAENLLRKKAVNFYGFENNADSRFIIIQIQPTLFATFQNGTIQQCRANIERNYLIFYLNRISPQDKIKIKTCLKELFAERALAPSKIVQNDNKPAPRFA